MGGHGLGADWGFVSGDGGDVRSVFFCCQLGGAQVDYSVVCGVCYREEYAGSLLAYTDS